MIIQTNQTLPSKAWAENQLRNSHTYPPLATSVLRLWTVLEDMNATTEQYKEILELLSILASGEAIFIDPDAEGAEWATVRDLVRVGATVRVHKNAFYPSHQLQVMNGQTGKVIAVRKGFAHVTMTDTNLGVPSIDVTALDTKVN